MKTLEQAVREIATDFFLEFDNNVLSWDEATAHTINFLYWGGFKQEKLGRDYGYTPEEALRFQLEEYAREHFGWTDFREGNE